MFFSQFFLLGERKRGKILVCSVNTCVIFVVFCVDLRRFPPSVALSCMEKKGRLFKNGRGLWAGFKLDNQ